MASSVPVCSCGGLLREGGWLCTRCSGRLTRDLAEIPTLLGEAETTRLRQSRTGGRGVGVTSRTAEQPLPFNDGPARAVAALLAALRSWSGFVAEGAGVVAPRELPLDMARFLLRHVPWLRQQEAVASADEELRGAVGRLRASVDRPADLTYAGICSAWTTVAGDSDDPNDVTLTRCERHLYVPFGRRTATCPACATVHDMAERRDVLLAALEDQLAHASLLSQGLSNLGRELNESTVRSWVFRKRLVAHGQDELGRALYRVGDVLDLMKAEALRQAELAAKREAAAAEQAKKRRAC